MVTVSEIKRQTQEAANALALAGELDQSDANWFDTLPHSIPLVLRPIFPEAPTAGADETTASPTERRPDQPEFAPHEEEPALLRGAELGTALHTALHWLDFDPFLDPSTPRDLELDQQIQNLRAAGFLDRAQYHTLSHARARGWLLAFFASPVFAALGEAVAQGGSYARETPFTLALGPSPDAGMVQGTIDLWFRSSEGVTLVDYKSDWLNFREFPDYPSRHAELERRYAVQLAIYATALERATQQRVLSRQIWHLSMEEAHSWPGAGSFDGVL